MEWNVRNEHGKVECVKCKICGPGEETSPPCHTSEVFDASSLSNACIPCKDHYYKAGNNTLNCKPCASVSCGNHTVLTKCSKTSPFICSSKCKKGYFKNSHGTCAKVCTPPPFDSTPLCIYNGSLSQNGSLIRTHATLF